MRNFSASIRQAGIAWLTDQQLKALLAGMARYLHNVIPEHSRIRIFWASDGSFIIIQQQNSSRLMSPEKNKLRVVIIT